MKLMDGIMAGTIVAAAVMIGMASYAKAAPADMTQATHIQTQAMSDVTSLVVAK